MRPRHGSALIFVLAAVVAAGACGEDRAEPPSRPPETIDRLPKLPSGWHEYVNHKAGFAIGRPPGWRAESDGATTLLRSPDQLVAISISADRTSEALEFPLDDYALAAAKALSGFRHFEVGRPHLFAARYAAQAVEASGVKHGIRQRLLFVALRRRKLATYAVLVARNSEQPSDFYGREALRVVRTLRGRPIG